MPPLENTASVLSDRLTAIGLGDMGVVLQHLPEDPEQRSLVLRRFEKGAWTLRRGVRASGGSGTPLSRDLQGFQEEPVLVVACAPYAVAGGKQARSGFMTTLTPADGRGKYLGNFLNDARGLGLSVGVPPHFVALTGGVPGWEDLNGTMQALLADKKVLNISEAMPAPQEAALDQAWQQLHAASFPLLCVLGWLGWASEQKRMPACLEAVAWAARFLADADTWMSRDSQVNADRAHASVLRHLDEVHL